MKRTVITLLFVVTALAAFAGGLIVNAAITPARAALAVPQDENQDEAAATTDDSDAAEVEQLTRIADALETIAGKSEKLDEIAASVGAIVERLAAIEEELAWKRLDSQEEQ